MKKKSIFIRYFIKQIHRRTESMCRDRLAKIINEDESGIFKQSCCFEESDNIMPDKKEKQAKCVKQIFAKVMSMMQNTFSKKNEDYGCAFMERGRASVLIDMTRKFLRLQAQIEEKENSISYVGNEKTLLPTLIDIANYAMIAAIREFSVVPEEHLESVLDKAFDMMYVDASEIDIIEITGKELAKTVIGDPTVRITDQDAAIQIVNQNIDVKPLGSKGVFPIDLG